MRRTIAILLVFLAIGGALNWAVTWAIAYVKPEGGETSSRDDSGFVGDRSTGNTWLVTRDRRLGMVSLERRIQDIRAYAREVPELTVPAWSDARIPPTVEGASSDDPSGDPTTSASRFVETAVGFPLHSMRYRYRFRHYPVGFSGNLYFFDHLSGGIILSRVDGLAHPNDWRGTLHVLPYQIIWWNFFINSALFGAILYVMTLMPRRVRRGLRKRRKQCPSCGYPTGVSDRCTECGTKLTAQRRTRRVDH